MGIYNFDDETKPLDDREKEAAREIYRQLEGCYGKARAMTNKQLRKSLVSYRGGAYMMSEARIRKIINFLRREAHLPNLIASAKGYYRTNDQEEFKRYLSGLKERGMSILYVVDIMERASGIDV